MTTQQNLFIHLITRKSKKAGFSSIYFRIKFNGTSSEISTKVKVPTSSWDRETQKVKGRDSEAVKLNRQIARQETDIVEIFEKLKYSDQPISAQKIKSIYLGNDEKCKMLLELVDYHYTKESSILSEGTLKNYRSTKLMLSEFLRKAQKRPDINLEELNYHFIYEFEMFLRTRKPDPGQKKPGQNTIMKHLQRLEKILKLGLKLGWLKENPAEHVKYRFVRKDREFLDDHELSKFENYKSSFNHLQRAADIFILMCYTGLGYSDLKSLTFQDLTRGIDGNLWIIDNRVKTNKKYTIPLLDKALEIISKYRNDENNDREPLMPLISNQKLNNHLKTIAQELNITKNLTSYVARHTFATTVTLNNDVPIESVSKMLGHTKISTTQIYSRVLEKKVSQDMNQLRKKLSNKNSNDSRNNAI